MADEQQPQQQDREALATLAAPTRRKAAAELRRARKLLENLHADLEKHGDPEIWKRYGDLLLANIGTATRDGDTVRVLAENAITEEKIDENAVENAMKRAEQELKEAKNLDPQQYEHLQSLVRYAGVQLAVKRRRR